MRTREWELPAEFRCCGNDLDAAATGMLVHAFCGTCGGYITTVQAPDMNESPHALERRRDLRRKRQAARDAQCPG